ncbi:unnamed protein product [Cuscuta campestris]|uniref:Uncharacterized protein n=1 Tax=Cuscuta campestris TaxID=132261 RepID=A0A484KC69_9ASTE|nr:unnamed protein product [Cuscuta campestris]
MFSVQRRRLPQGCARATTSQVISKHVLRQVFSEGDVTNKNVNRRTVKSFMPELQDSSIVKKLCPQSKTSLMLLEISLAAYLETNSKYHNLGDLVVV